MPPSQFDLSPLLLTAYLGDDPALMARDASAWYLDKWAHRLAALAQHVPKPAYPDLLPLMGESRPYLFERNLSRWPDGKYRLVDRDHEEVPGIVFDMHELKDLGWVAWNESPNCSIKLAGSSLAVMDDDFERVATPASMMELAHLLQSIVKRVSVPWTP